MKLKFLFAVFFQIVLVGSLFAQGNKLVITTTVSGNVGVCASVKTCSLKIENNTATAASNLTIKTTLPEGINYRGNLSGGATFVSASPLNHPQFSLATLAANTTITLTFDINADCGIIAYLRASNPNINSPVPVTNYTRIDYEVGETSYFDQETSNSYNVIYPDIDIMIDDLSKTMTGDMRDVLTRKIIIRNTGFGEVDTVNLKATYPSQLLFQELRSNGVLITPEVQGNIRNFLIKDFSGANSALGNGSVGDGDALLEKDEVLVLTEKIRLESCASSTQTDYEVTWGCYNAIGNLNDSEAKNSAYVYIPDGEPNIDVALLNSPKTDFCASSPVDVFYSYTNVGTGSTRASADRATDVRIYLGYQTGVSQISNFRIMKNGSYISIPSGLISADLGGYYYITFDNNAAVLGVDVDGTGGLDDLDNDGYFDDLAKGEVIKIGFGVKLSCPASFAACPSNYDYYYFSTNLQYSDGCFNYDYKASGTSFLRNYSTLNSQSISGPTDLIVGQTGVYTFSVDRNYYDYGLLSCSSNPSDFSTEIDIPAAYTPTSVKWNGTTLTSGTHYTLSGQKLTINYGGWSGAYTISFTLNCSSGTTYQLNDSFTWNMYYKCGTCSCRQTIACGTYNVINHCPNCDGFHTYNFSMKRTSLGYVEPGAMAYRTLGNWKTFGKVSINDPNIRLDRALEYDTILAVAKGNLTLKNYDKCFVEMTYTSPVYGIDVFNFLNASAIINGATCASSVSAPTVTISGANVTYLFQIPLTCKNSYASGDMVDLYVNLSVKPNVLALNAESKIMDFRARHYGQTGTNAKESCESFGSFISLFRYGVNNANFGGPLDCDVVQINIAMLAGPNGDLFPGEFRPLFIVDSAWVNIPNGFVLNNNNDPGNLVQTWDNFSRGIPGIALGPPDGMVGNTVYWKGKPFWPVGENYRSGNWSTFIRVILKPLCGVGSPSVSGSYRYSMYEYTSNKNVIVKGTKTTGQVFDDGSKANLSIAPDAMQEGYSTTIKWPVQLCNNAVPGKKRNADYTWIAAEPRVPGIVFLYAKDTQTGMIYTANNYGGANSNKVLFKVGTVALNQCRSIELVARYTGCIDDVVDTIDLKASWGCTVYPNDPAQKDCGNPLITSQLYIRYKTAGLQVIGTQVSPVLTEICSNISYQFDFLSTKYADMSDLKLWMELPQGVSLVDANTNIEYPMGQPPLGEVNKLGNGSLGYNISEYILSNFNNSCNKDGALPGNRPGCPNNQLILKLDLKTDCSLDAGFPEPIRFYAQGKTNCNDVIYIPPFEYRLKIQGFDPLDLMLVDVNATSFDANNFSDVTVLYKNTGTVTLGTNLPAVLRYLKVILPPGITLDHMVTGSNYVLSHTLSDGSKAYYWPISALAPNASATISFTVKNVGFATSCEVTRVPIYASTVMLNTITCSGQPQCTDIEATTASDVYILPIPINVINCDCITSFAPFEGDKYTLSAWVKQGNSEGLTKYEDGGIILYFEGSMVTMGPIYPSGEIIDGWQKIEYDFTIPVNSTNIEVQLANKSRSSKAYFDDIRIHPFNSNMKSYVYDPVSLRLWAELDENNYATFYEYDEEGALIRVKKETERGVKTIQESRNNTVKRP
jgi:hypothetical protein